MIKCKQCGKEVDRVSTAKLCYDCVLENKKEGDRKYREKHREELSQKKKEQYNSGKKYKCAYCGKEYIRASWCVGKYCSRECFEKDEREKRQGKGNPSYKHGKRIQSDTTIKHLRVCKEYKRKFIEENGLIFCEICGTNQSIQFNTHHIVFASQAPKHKELHNHKNLILVCSECHHQLHSKVWLRNELVKERGLEELFKMKLLREPR